MSAPLPQESPEYWEKLLEKLEQRVDAQEELIANLMMGYIELAVAVEQCMEKILEPLDEDARKEFSQRILDQKQDMFRILNQVSKSTGKDTRNEANIARTMADMAKAGDSPLPGE